MPLLKSLAGNGSMGTKEAKDENINLVELASYVPLRLTPTERHLLAVLEQTMRVSEYTDNVDISSRRGGNMKTRRILDGILEVCYIATGLASASGQERQLATLCAQAEQHGRPTAVTKKKKKKKLRLKKGGRKNKVAAAAPAAGTSYAAREPAENEAFFQTLFEVGRRNKVLNPASMRTTYGKLMYLLQDAQNPSVAKSLGFSLHKDILLVKPFLEERGGLDLLHDARLECAVQFISDRDANTGTKLAREQVQALVQGKQKVTADLVDAYTTDTLSADDVKRVIESLADAIAYIESNVRPVQQMLKYLEEVFDPEREERGFSLTLRGTSRSYSSPSSLYSSYGLSAYGGGSSSEGPTLSHSHPTQYTFVWQSLRLWCKVMRHMHRLWVCADDDLLSTTCTYHLYNTGQGLNRVQPCPRVKRVMSNLLHQTQQEAGASWVGLSVIHLGDRDVPNALIFIDKYTQIPRFLSPIVHFLQNLPDLCSDPRIASYIQEQFGSMEQLRKTVLADYFKHGFDGSGDDGGSCMYVSACFACNNVGQISCVIILTHYGLPATLLLLEYHSDGRLTSSWNWTSRIAKKSYYHAFMLSGFQGFDGEFR